MSRGKKHPPKKKYPNKPRPLPVQPLSDLDRSIRGQEEFDRACIHLFEAEKLAEFSQTPMHASIPLTTPCIMLLQPHFLRPAV
jgi:hypothetical protein